MTHEIKALVVAVLVALAGGCHSTQAPAEHTSPTHRWLPADVGITQARYNQHHSRCVAQTGVNPQAIRRMDPAFEQYEQCMTAKGYTLATY